MGRMKVLGSWAIAGAAALTLGSVAQAQVEWDFPTHYPSGNFHAIGMVEFAEKVAEATDGEVTINVHAGGALGFRGPDMLAAVRDGLVPIGDVAINIQTGEEPLFGLEGLPFLVADYDELEVLHKHFRPVLDEITETRHNQKILYMVPWPVQYLHSRNRIDGIEDMAGVPIRTTQASVTEMFNRLGMVSIQLPWGEVVPALAAGTIQGVATSATSGVDGAFWEFLGYFTPTNHVWNSEIFTVNLDAWNSISEEARQAILEVAAAHEREQWEVSRAEDEERAQQLIDNGMELVPMSEETMAEMRRRTAPMVETYMERYPEAKPIIDAYLAELGRSL